MKKIEVEIDIDTNLKSVEDLRSEISKLEEEFETVSIGSDRFVELGNKIKAANSQLKDIELQFEALDKEQRATALVDTFTGVAGAITAATGALTLFGIESDDLEVVEKRILGLLAVTSGLRDISNGIVAANKLLGPSFTAVGNSIKAAFTTGTVAAQTFKAALASLGIGLLIAGIAELITNFDKIKQAITGIDPALEELNQKWREQAKAIKDAGEAALQASSSQFNNLGNRLRDIQSSGGDLTVVLEDIKKVIPEAAKVTLDQADAYDQLDKIVTKYSRQQEEVIKRDTLLKEVSNLVAQQTEAVDNGYTDLAASIGRKINATRDEITQLNISINSYDLFNQQLQKNLQLAQQEEAQRKANAAKYKQIADERKKRAQQLADEVELIGLGEVERAKILAQREFDARIEGFKEGSQAYKDALALFNEEIRQIEVNAATKRAEDVKKAEEDFAKGTQEEYQATLANTEAFYQQERNLAAQQFLNKEITQQEYNARLREIDEQAYQSALIINEDYGQDNLAVTSDYLQKQVDATITANEEEVENTKAAEEAKNQAREQGFQLTSAVLNGLSGLFEQGSKEQKALALGAIAADTARALTGALANSNSPTPDNVATGGLAGIAKYATLAITILGNAARAKQVLASGNESSGKPTTTSPSTFTPAAPVNAGIFNVSGAPATDLFGETIGGVGRRSSGGTVRAYVLAGDVSSGLEADNRLNRRRKF